MNSITTTSDNQIWYSTFLGEPGSFTPSTGQEFTTENGILGFNAVKKGPDGNLWFCDGPDNAIVVYTPTGDFAAWYNLGNLIQPNDMTVAPDGTVWIVGTTTDNSNPETASLQTTISRIGTDGSVSNFLTGTWSTMGQQITVGGDGSVWATANEISTWYSDSNNNNVIAYGRSALIRLDPNQDNLITKYTVDNGTDCLYGISTAPDGSVFFVQTLGNIPQYPSTQQSIDKITLNSDYTISLTKFVTMSSVDYDTSPQLYHLAIADDGNVWFNEFRSSTISSLNPSSGAITSYDVPSGIPFDLTVGADHNIWFTERNIPVIGMIDLSQLQPTTQPTITANGTSLSSLAELAYHGPVATFTSNLPHATTSSFSASIDWGNGTSSTGTISLADDGVTYVVSGTNTYNTAGTYALAVSISSPDVTTPAVANTTATIQSSLYAVGNTTSHIEQASFTDTIATFVGPVPTSGYTATIYWGDSTSSVGTIVATSSGYAVKGTHTYSTQGTYNTTVTIADAYQIATVTGQNIIADIPLIVTGQTISALLPKIALGFVATFTDDPQLSASNFTASINWGDGSTSGGIIVANPLKAGSFYVLGAHIYKKRGTFITATTITNKLEGSLVTALGKVIA